MPSPWSGVYFEVFDSDLFAGNGSLADRVPKDLRLGRSFILYLYLFMLIGGAVLAWRNFRSGKSDRRGSFRISFFVFCAGMVAWVFLANHKSPPNGGVVNLEIGMAQALVRAVMLWIFYTALEPFVRRIWPQTLISWARLVEGRWRDPRVGRDVLVGVAIGIVFNLAPWCCCPARSRQTSPPGMRAAA